jgi:hypothetical protein
MCLSLWWWGPLVDEKMRRREGEKERSRDKLGCDAEIRPGWQPAAAGLAMLEIIKSRERDMALSHVRTGSFSSPPAGQQA